MDIIDIILEHSLYKLREYKPIYFARRIPCICDLIPDKTSECYFIGYKYPWQSKYKIMYYESSYKTYKEAMEYIKERYGQL